MSQLGKEMRLTTGRVSGCSGIECHGRGVSLGLALAARGFRTRYCSMPSQSTDCIGVSQSAVLGQFYNPNTTPKDKERVVVCLCGTGQELH